MKNIRTNFGIVTTLSGNDIRESELIDTNEIQTAMVRLTHHKKEEAVDSLKFGVMVVIVFAFIVLAGSIL
jgi:hypothetical protein